MRKNYASEKRKMKDTVQTNISLIEQKYEKVGVIGSKSNDFEKDEVETRALIKKSSSIIQYEVNSGLDGRRNLLLGIGVQPDKFDEMVLELKKIGKIESIQINKSDKTSEFSDLNAKKNSLFKARESLVNLKNRASSGKIEELINLEDKILQVEESIQKLGVELGQFNLENEFCTIKFSLIEVGIKSSNSFISKLLHNLKTSLEWTIKYYFILCISYFLFIFSVKVSLSLFEKLKPMLIRFKNSL
jgi:hypothetical protein